MADLPASAAVGQQPGAVRAYAAELTVLTRQLDPDEGWYAVFADRDPSGLRDCLSGREVPPWDVVASLVQDLKRRHGPVAAARAESSLRRLHGAAVAAYDAHMGGEPVLRERLAAASRELETAGARLRVLEDAVAGQVPNAVFGMELAWARDYLARLDSRCAELGARMAALDGSARAAPYAPARTAQDAPAGTASEASATTASYAPARTAPDVSAAARTPEPTPRKRRVRTGGSRFAGHPGDVEDADAQPVPIVPPGAPSPDLTPPADAPGKTGSSDGKSGAEDEPVPRGARFAGAFQPVDTPRSEPTQREVAEAREAAGEAVARLLRLRHAERGGEAHAVLSTATGWPAFHLAVLVGELQRNGLDADAGTLLWEAAALPAAEFAAVADALATTGRGTDSARLLRQGVARPLPEIADVALTLHRAGHRAGVREFLAALIRSRTPTEAAQIIYGKSPLLVEALLEAAGALSAQHHRSVADALRGLGLPGVPEVP